MMDLGATRCLPANPKCPECPLRKSCRAYRRRAPTAYPRPKKRALRPRKSVAMLIITNRRGEYLLYKRPPHGIWGGLWSLPEIAAGPRARTETLRRQFAREYGMDIAVGEARPAVRHAFTHFELEIRPRFARLAAPNKAARQLREPDAYIWYNPRQPPAIGLPAVSLRIIRNL